MGLAGLGQAEVSAITRAHVDLEAGQGHCLSPQNGHWFPHSDLSATAPAGREAVQRKGARPAFVFDQ